MARSVNRSVSAKSKFAELYVATDAAMTKGLKALRKAKKLWARDIEVVVGGVVCCKPNNEDETYWKYDLCLILHELVVAVAERYPYWTTEAVYRRYVHQLFEHMVKSQPWLTPSKDTSDSKPDGIPLLKYLYTEEVAHIKHYCKTRMETVSG